MVDGHKTRNVFVLWEERMDVSDVHAAQLLGKSLRMVKYYEAGHPIPQAILLLMDALQQGYRPTWRKSA
jgi:hypothetical protein